MSAKPATHYGFDGVKRRHRGLQMLVLALLMAAPMKVLAASVWCSWFPWWFGCGGLAASCGTGLTEVSSFGSNPGNLKMCTYVPDDLETSRPLVVAMHGCTQQASDYDDETGWVQFANKHNFALLLPQQQQANNATKCFNWFERGDIERDQGEALSIRQMIDKIVADVGLDSKNVYVTGLSAGGGMTAVMLAAYPELFAGGAIIAGVPYRCATNAGEALSQCGVSLSTQVAPVQDLSPEAWGDRVRDASDHQESFPRVSIWQGTSDSTINPENQRELVDQWTNVLGIDQIPDTEDTIGGHEHKLYENASGDVLVETVLINGMGHGKPIDPGNAEDQCGRAAPYILDVGICSAFHIVRFWGLESP